MVILGFVFLCRLQVNRFCQFPFQGLADAGSGVNMLCKCPFVGLSDVVFFCGWEGGEVPVGSVKVCFLGLSY